MKFTPYVLIICFNIITNSELRFKYLKMYFEKKNDAKFYENVLFIQKLNGVIITFDKF